MFAHTVLTGRYGKNVFRFCIHPEPIAQFPDSPVLQIDLELEKMTVHKDAQGRLISRKQPLQFIYDPPTGNYRMQESAKEVMSGILHTGKFNSPLLVVRLEPEDRIYGFGASPRFSVRNNRRFQLLNRDTLFYSLPGASYSSFPFFIIRRKNRYSGIFLHSTIPASVSIDTSPDDPRRSEIRFDFLSSPEVAIPLDIFVIRGTPAEILASYSGLTGRTFFPPLWSLGYHQSRWSYRSQERVLEVAGQFRKEGIPCDAIHLDIHYMNRYRNFTWNPRRYPDPAAMNRTLGEMGIRSVAIVDPSVSTQPKFTLYEEGHSRGYFCKRLEGDEYRGNSWGGKCAFPDFTMPEVRRWWAEKHEPLFQAGVSGIWNDMNEPVLKLGSRQNPLVEGMVHSTGSHTEVRNLYANLEALSTHLAFEKYLPEERPFLLTRAGHPGIQRSSALWTGDNHSRWEHLRENLNMVLNLSLSGVPFTGADVGGFASGTGRKGLFKLLRNKELFVRWMELGSLMPFFRNHTVLYSLDQEPWSVGAEHYEAVKKQIRRRYRLLPYLYTLFWQSHTTGAPIVRPLFYEYPDMEEIVDDQFFLGGSLMVAPVMEPGVTVRRLYLPPGEWYDYETGERVSGGEWYECPTSPGTYPLFVRAGSILPQAVEVRENAERTLESGVALELYPTSDGRDLEGSLFIDGGTSRRTVTKGEYYYQWFSGTQDRSRNLQLVLNIVRRKFSPSQKTFLIRLPHEYRHMLLKGKRVEGELTTPGGEGRSGQFMQYEIPTGTPRVEFLFQSDRLG